MTEKAKPAAAAPVGAPVGKPLKGLDQLEAVITSLVARTDGLIKRTHIGNVLTMSAILENQLRGALNSHMPHRSKKLEEKLYDASGPLATFSAKIKIAQAFGIISAALAAELDKIKGIRNTFAHTDENISFETPEIVKAVNRLEIRSSTKDKPAEAIFQEAFSIAFEGLVDAHNKERSFVLDPKNPFALAASIAATS